MPLPQFPAFTIIRMESEAIPFLLLPFRPLGIKLIFHLPSFMPHATALESLDRRRYDYHHQKRAMKLCCARSLIIGQPNSSNSILTPN